MGCIYKAQKWIEFLIDIIADMSMFYHVVYFHMKICQERFFFLLYNHASDVIWFKIYFRPNHDDVNSII